MSEPAVDIRVPSDTVLDGIPARALKFFGAVSTNPHIRAALARRGYSQSIHDEAWALLLKAAGYRRAVEPSPDRPEAVAAIAELDDWDEPNFRVARAALLSMPEQRDFVFRDLSPARGAAAVVSVRTFLDRLDELENGEDRKATRKADHAALKKLAERRIDQAERSRLRELIAAATALPAEEAPAPPEDAEKTETLAAEQREAKIKLWALWAEWSEVARAEIKRRDYLIQLGLAKRKTTKKGQAAADEAGAAADA